MELFPVEIWGEIIRHLELEDSLNLILTNKEFNSQLSCYHRSLQLRKAYRLFFPPNFPWGREEEFIQYFERGYVTTLELHPERNNLKIFEDPKQYKISHELLEPLELRLSDFDLLSSTSKRKWFERFNSFHIYHICCFFDVNMEPVMLFVNPITSHKIPGYVFFQGRPLTEAKYYDLFYSPLGSKLRSYLFIYEMNSHLREIAQQKLKQLFSIKRDRDLHKS